LRQSERAEREDDKNEQPRSAAQSDEFAATTSQVKRAEFVFR